MSEEEIIKFIKENNYNENNVEKLLYELENDTGNYSCLDNIKAIIYYRNLYNREEEQRKNGTLSDGFHTYNDLYYQRCILFSALCNLNKENSWKSKKHSDGKKCFDSDEWFIVGIDTPEGSYTYHYEIKYWDLFKIQELNKGKEWDGHTEKDVTRLLSLRK